MSCPVQDACLRPYEPPTLEPLTRLPREGDKVRICSGGPLLVVVGFPVPDACNHPPVGTPPFWVLIRVLYFDKNDHIAYSNVPFGTLRHACER
jgi:hypothetical protein